MSYTSDGRVNKTDLTELPVTTLQPADTEVADTPDITGVDNADNQAILGTGDVKKDAKDNNKVIGTGYAKQGAK